ncbi:hypothetical protein BD560DRAFT_408398 [Blakeslea trispora]|nr:hypothetical protein BD560DRAFT_408398 [Blakeslea trispora]
MNWSIPECSADGLIVGDNQSNINKLFFDYQISCLENFKLQQFYNWRTDIQKLLSLSSIIFLDGVRGTCDFIEDTTYQCLYDLIFSEYREAGQLSSDIITSLQDIVWEYQKQFSHWTTIKKVVEVYEKYKTDKLVLCILETILALLPEMTIQDSNRSEMHVQSSYVHNLTKSIFKTDPWHHPHCSNKSNNFYGTRPDYLVGISTQRSKLNNVFGECKGRDSSLDSCNKDKYRLALFSQVAMQQQQLKSIISFFSLDNEVTFYIMKKTNDLYYFVQIAKIVIPTTESTFKTTGSYFGEIASIRQIYTSQCHEEDAAETEIKPLPWTVLTNMTCKK